MCVTIIKLTPTDIGKFTELISLFEHVFEMKNFKIPQEAYLQLLLENHSFFVFVALLNEKIVGGLTAYILQQYYFTSPLVYIYDLAVEPTVQRQGIGKKLISAFNNYCKQLGVEEVFVQADEEDEHAIEFYRSIGGREEKVVHFNYALNER